MLWLKKQWCIPPETNAEFVCTMEDVLEVYKRPQSDAHPCVCMDESSKQQLKEPRTPLPIEPGPPQKYDSEVNWRFTTADAGIKLKRLYPVVER